MIILLHSTILYYPLVQLFAQGIQHHCSVCVCICVHFGLMGKIQRKPSSNGSFLKMSLDKPIFIFYLQVARKSGFQIKCLIFCRPLSVPLGNTTLIPPPSLDTTSQRPMEITLLSLSHFWPTWPTSLSRCLQKKSTRPTTGNALYFYWQFLSV